MSVEAGSQQKSSEKRDNSLQRYITDSNLIVKRYHSLARRLSGSAKAEEIASGERNRYNFQHVHDTLYRTSQRIESEWDLMPLSKKVLLCADLCQKPKKRNVKQKRLSINIIEPVREPIEEPAPEEIYHIPEMVKSESSNLSIYTSDSSSFLSEQLEKRCLPKFNMYFMRNSCKNQSNSLANPERLGQCDKLITQCIEIQNSNPNGTRSQDNTPKRKTCILNRYDHSRDSTKGTNKLNPYVNHLSFITQKPKGDVGKESTPKVAPTQQPDSMSNVTNNLQNSGNSQKVKLKEIVLHKYSNNTPQRAIDRHMSSLRITPSCTVLEHFFAKKKASADIWKAALFDQISQQKSWSENELNWAAQKLCVLSRNAANSRRIPANSSVNNGVKTKIIPTTFNHISEVDNSLISDGGSSRSRAYLPYTNNLKKQKDTIGLKHNEYKSERHGSFLEPLITSDKITPEAQEILLVFRDTISLVIDDIISIDREITSRNFNPCISLVEHLLMLPNMLIALIDHLHYTPQEFELVSVAKSITYLIEDVSGDPVVVLFRMIELGHNLYYLGRLLGENIVPKELPRLLYSIQVKLQRMKVGRVVRQYFHIPISFDFVITPYNKDRQLLRLEEDCRCLVNLLHPDDPRSQYCPSGYRTIEVLYDEENGRFESFHHRLNRILSPRRCTARLVTTILRQFNGHEMAMTAEHASDLLNSDHRPKYEDIRALVVSGNRYSREKRLSQLT